MNAKSNKTDEKKKNKNILGWGMAENAREKLDDRGSELDRQLAEIEGTPPPKPKKKTEDKKKK